MLLKAERKFGPEFEDDSEEEQAMKQELEELAAQANVKIEEDNTKKQVRKSQSWPGSPTHRQQAIIIKQRVHLHGSFCRGIMRPVVDRQRKRYECRIQQPQRHLKTEFAMSPPRLLSEMLIEVVEDVPEYRTVAVGVLICHCRF